MFAQQVAVADDDGQFVNQIAHRRSRKLMTYLNWLLRTMTTTFFSFFDECISASRGCEHSEVAMR
jgi:hypothetical protein